MPYKYIGKTTDFRGKSLWEILGNLKNFGIGRIVVRSRFERYSEESYMKILKVETYPEPEKRSIHDRRKIRVWVERTFRGKTIPEPAVIYRSTYKADYRLIPKDEEAKYCKKVQNKSVENNPSKILPRTMDFPPLLKELILRESGAIKDPKLPFLYCAAANYRIAQEGETPSFEFSAGLGTPASPSLYANIKDYN